MLQQYRALAYAQLHQIQDTINAMNTPLAAPTIAPAGGSFTAEQSVTMTGPVGATIYYTVDSTDPTTASTAYTAEITLSASATVKAIAVQTNFITSAVASAVFVIA